tara:strand:+ start:3832 stop:4491 length:660 start_codon:yes stop_codon:yes gene_type:complete
MVKRIKSATTSVETINLKKPTGDVVKGVKKDQAWMYPDGKIKRAESVRLGSKDYYDDKDPTLPRRKHESNFLITLNTNKTLREGPDGALAKEACKLIMDEMGTDKRICEFLKFGPKSRWYENDLYADVIKQVEWQACVEVGEQINRLHCHIWLTVHHYSQVQVNMPVIQRMFKTMYNQRVGLTGMGISRNPYVNVKLLPTSDWAQVIRGYLRKGMQMSQ